MFIETIEILNGIPQRLHYHNERYHHTRCGYYGIQDDDNLVNYIDVPDAFKQGRVKCRLLYGMKIEEITYEKYKVKKIDSMKLVHDEDIHYKYKYADRSRLHHNYEMRGDCDDIIVVKEGILTDSYYANLVFVKDQQYLTPDKPLLNGTRRQYLLEQGVIKEQRLTIDDIKSYEYVTLINAMLSLDTVRCSTDDIIV